MSENAAAAAAAAQHLQAAAALTAGMDERSLPPGLAQMANMARRMNGGGMQGGMPGGDMGGNQMNGMPGGGNCPPGPNMNMMGMNNMNGMNMNGMNMNGMNMGNMNGMNGMNMGNMNGMNMNGMNMGNMNGMNMNGMNMGNNPMMAMAAQQQARSRRGDPPADPPSGTYGGMMPDGSLGPPATNKRKMPLQGGMMKKVRVQQDIFDDAEEED